MLCEISDKGKHNTIPLECKIFFKKSNTEFIDTEIRLVAAGGRDGGGGWKGGRRSKETNFQLKQLSPRR